jgi:hypothetical protein
MNTNGNAMDSRYYLHYIPISIDEIYSAGVIT